MSFRVGVDIGGTFTDLVCLAADGRLHTKKISSSVEDYAAAIATGLKELFSESGLTGRDVNEIRHGTTVASNAILEQRGARTGLIATRGFRDILEIRNMRMPRLYDLRWEKPPPLVPRYLRMTVDERVDARGKVQTPLDEADAGRAIDRLLAEKVDVIAVCLLNSFAEPAHELALKRAIEKKAPGLPVCISYEVLPEIKEYERTSTTVINAYVMPIVSRYLKSLRQRLDGAGVRAGVLLMQSNGGLTTEAVAARMPVHIVESGPAGGVVGAQALARALGLPSIITFDMGGTTAKASMVENGEITRAHESEVGGGVISSSRLLTGAGYTLKVPAIDLAEVGAGGGSILWIDAGGALQIGPRSAGAMPGPVCYGLGGSEPTVTDANVVLGYINPEYLVGGGVRLDAEKSSAVLEEKIAQPLGLSLERAAYGAHQIAAANMIRAIKSVSSERGRDPRQYALFAFGGNGPLFAAGMAEALGMKRIVVPPSPGLFSSFGLLYAMVEHHYSRTFRTLLRGVERARLEQAWTQVEKDARSQLAAEGFTGARARIERQAHLRYEGQTFELVVRVPDGPLDAQAIAGLEESFGREHERTYGHRAGAEEPVELVTISVLAQGIGDGPLVPAVLKPSRGDGPNRPLPRRAYFGPGASWLETPVLRRADLAERRSGPLIVEEYDATCVVPPGATAQLDAYGNIGIDL
jgi:N-methylhydantoinase A